LEAVVLFEKDGINVENPVPIPKIPFSRKGLANCKLLVKSIPNDRLTASQMFNDLQFAYKVFRLAILLT
jgi:hypothetical protein